MDAHRDEGRCGWTDKSSLWHKEAKSIRTEARKGNVKSPQKKTRRAGGPKLQEGCSMTFTTFTGKRKKGRPCGRCRGCKPKEETSPQEKKGKDYKRQLKIRAKKGLVVRTQHWQKKRSGGGTVREDAGGAGRTRTSDERRRGHRRGDDRSAAGVIVRRDRRKGKKKKTLFFQCVRFPKKGTKGAIAREGHSKNLPTSCGLGKEGKGSMEKGRDLGGGEVWVTRRSTYVILRGCLRLLGNAMLEGAFGARMIKRRTARHEAKRGKGDNPKLLGNRQREETPLRT